MKRREFIGLFGAAAVTRPRAARAQQSTIWRIGIATIQSRSTPIYAAFEQRLRELGYVEGQNLVLDYLNPETQAEGVAGAIKELLRRKVDIIVAPYESGVKAALAASDTVPVVMIATEYDPLALGYVNSLARPGGHVTGVFLQQIELASKRLQLFKCSSKLPVGDHVLGCALGISMEGNEQRCSALRIAARWRRIGETALRL
jgi:putative tryptophan/tyrosine transport system substrate-binding protein